MTSIDWSENEEIQYFREYLRIPSVHPQPNYEPCVQFLRQQADQLQLPLQIFYPADNANPIVVMTWTGLAPTEPAILLNSHMDVVPVFAENWTHPPFDADIDAKGFIYARGAQDMKCVGMQYLAAVRSLKRAGVRLRRTVHLSFVADEEMGGRLGMRPFVHTDDFRALNVGFALDEGLASPDDTFKVFYAERSVWRFYLHITGTAGHGSLLLKNTAGEKLYYVLNKMMERRCFEVQRLENNPELTIGDVTTVNLTRLSGGVQSNVVPPLLTACFDVRLALDVDQTEFEAQLHRWFAEAGGGIDVEYEQKRPRVEPTKCDDRNPYWVAFKCATDELGLKIKAEVFTGGTDSRYVREVGIPALGFSPMNQTPVLLHDHDECIQADVYLRGIEIYKNIIQKVANL